MPTEPEPTTPITNSGADIANGLPLALAKFLEPHRYACVSQLTNRGTAYMLNAPDADLETLKGPIPIWGALSAV